MNHEQMQMEFVRKLPIPQEIKKQFPISEKIAQHKAERDEAIRRVFTGESDKFLLIIGPCSADSEEPVMEYIHRLARVQEKVADKIIMIPINPGQQAKATKACSTSRTLRNSRIFWKA